MAESLFDAGGQKTIIFISQKENQENIKNTVFFKLCESNLLLEKEFKDEELVEILNSIINGGLEKNDDSGPMKKINETEEDYVSIGLKSFYLHEELPYDVFYKVYEGSYLKVISKDQKFTQSTIQNISKKRVKELYLTKSDRLKHVEASIKHAIKELSQFKLSTNESFKIQAISIELIQSCIIEFGVTKEIIILTEKVIEMSYFLLKRADHKNKIFNELPISFLDKSEQSLFLLYLSFSITMDLSWQSIPTLKKIGLACIIHDIKIQGEQLSKIRNINDEKFEYLDVKQKEIFKMHGELAAIFSKEFTDFPDCGFIIEEHHIPAIKKYTQSMNSISCLFNLSRRFTTELKIYGYNKVGFGHALKELTDYDLGNFRKPYNALMKIFTAV